MKVARLFGLTTAALLVAAPAGLTSVAAGSADARDAAAVVSTASCQVAAFDTSQSRFRPGFDNQGTVWGNAIEPPNGYWEGAAAHTRSASSGRLPTSSATTSRSISRRFAAGSATGAVLVLRNGNDWSYGPGGLFRIREVVTRSTGTEPAPGPPKRVFNDLGKGPVYGAKRIIESTATGPVVRIPLNATGVAAVNAAAGGFFSVGGRLTNPDVEFFSILWRSTSSSQGVQRLLVTTNDCS